jgi:hypothetical protein
VTWRQHQVACAKEYFAALMAKHGGCVKAIAIESGLHRGDVYRKLQSLGLVRPKRWGNDAWHELQSRRAS